MARPFFDVTLWLLGQGVLFGAACRAVYDPLSALQGHCPRALLAVLDVCYFLLLSLSSFAFFLVTTDGEVRAALLAAFGGGAFLWHVTFGRLHRALYRAIFALLGKGIHMVRYRMEQIRDFHEKK